MSFPRTASNTATMAAPGARMALAKACAKQKRLESHPYGLFLVQVTAAAAIVPLSVSFCRSWEQGKGSLAQQGGHQGRAGLSQRDREGTCLSSLQAVTGAEGQHDLSR